MLNTKLLLIDGITGSGKSTTAQFLAEQLNKNKIQVKWYHEEADGHPLDYEEDIEVFASQADMEEFLATTPELWRQFVEEVEQTEEVHIVESFLLQDMIRLLFQNKLAKERIIEFAREIEEIIRPLNPVLIYFYQQNASHSIRRIWKRRGAAWKKWFIESDIQTPYVKEGDLKGEEGVIKLWSDYQDFTNQLFKIYGIKKLAVENSAGNWEDYRRKILGFLDLKLYKEDKYLSLQEKKRYCGTYQEQDGEVKCTVRLLDGDLVCDLIWPDIRLLSVNDQQNYFCLESFSVFIKFQENQGCLIEKMTLSGREEFAGKVLYNT